MPSITIVGVQWGDEGKGKIVDWLAANADVVVRFQGGHNAGHTLVVDGVTYKLSLLPSGIVRPHTLSIIGNGVVINPWALLEEIDKIGRQGIEISSQNLLIADNAHLILPPHWQVDQMRERVSGANKIGTTGRGIGPAYEDKVARRGIRICDLFDAQLLQSKIDKLLAHHNVFLRAYDIPEINSFELHRQLLDISSRITPYVGQSWRALEERKHQRILFEGAQGVMLDIDHGTYPFVTSSSTVSHSVYGEEHHTLGVAKAYATRVGSGPFPTENHESVGDMIGERGHEFGTVTGRKRRCGWLDAVMLRQAIQIGGVQSLVLTKIDVLDVFEEISICVGYRLNGQELDYFPSGTSEQAAIEPIYETLRGWKSSTRGIRQWDALPQEAQAYVRRVEALIGIPISVISTSPDRKDTILRCQNFLKNSVDLF